MAQFAYNEDRVCDDCGKTQKVSRFELTRIMCIACGGRIAVSRRALNQQTKHQDAMRRSLWSLDPSPSRDCQKKGINYKQG